ncbi:MAG: DUF3572 domain-containing protein [Pseudomonadota bacterium]
MQQEIAETEAIKALAWLAVQEDLVGTFLGSSGLSVDDMRAGAGEPEFLGSVLDFIMLDDAWVMALCDAEGWPYTRLMELRAALPGGQNMHWT